jgi:hypothetical protein
MPFIVFIGYFAIFVINVNAFQCIDRIFQRILMFLKVFEYISKTHNNTMSHIQGNTCHGSKEHIESQVIVFGKWQYPSRPKNQW